MLGLLICACSGSDHDEPLSPVAPTDTVPGTNAEPVAVGFTAAFADATTATRAIGDGEYGLDNEQLKATGFGVYCWYTGSTPVTFSDAGGRTPTAHIGSFLGATGYMLMRNQRVEYAATLSQPTPHWTYSPTKYWPLQDGELLTLRAYAPYTDYLPTDALGMPQLPVIVSEDDYKNGTQHDPLWGTSLHDGDTDAATDNQVYGLLYNNYTRPMSGSLLAADQRDGIIDWYFHHGMSRLMFACSVVADPGCDRVVIKGITVTPLYQQGLLDLGSATATAQDKPTWTERDGDMTVSISEETVIETGAEATDYHNLLSKGLLIIPRDFGAPATPMTVTVSYSIDNDSDVLTAVGTIRQDFEGNTSYTVRLSLTPSTRGLEITIVHAAFTQWQTGGTGSHTVYNW